MHPAGSQPKLLFQKRLQSPGRPAGPSLFPTGSGRGLLPCLVVGFCLLGLWRPATAQTVWELTPYRVQVLMAFQYSPELTPALQDDFVAGLTGRIDALLAPAWETTVARAPQTVRAGMLAQIDSVSWESLPKEALAFDKVMLLAVLRGPAGYSVQTREFDVRTRVGNQVIQVAVGQPAKLRDAALRSLCRAFAPLARVESVERKAVGMRLRAASLPPRDKSLVWVRPGSVFQPVLRRNDREGNSRGVLPVPWTFLVVDQVAQALLKSTLHTGLPGPLSSRSRGRIDQLAVALIPPNKATRLLLQSRTEPRQPLPGYDVFEQAADGKSLRFLGRSDRRGTLMIQPAPQTVRVLLVKHGGEMLARLPVVPGWPAELSAAIPNDDQRLAAEQAITEFQEMLVDLITRRELLLARARVALKAARFDQAETLINELHMLESRDQLEQRLNQLQSRIVSNDAAVQRKIDSLFADTRQILQKHISPDTIENLRRQVSQARAEGPRPAP